MAKSFDAQDRTAFTYSHSQISRNSSCVKTCLYACTVSCLLRLQGCLLLLPCLLCIMLLLSYVILTIHILFTSCPGQLGCQHIHVADVDSGSH